MICTVADIIKWRMRNERIVKGVGEGQVDVPGLGVFNTRMYRGMKGEHHLALFRGELGASPTLVRVQAAPPAWSFLAPDSSRLAVQAKRALQQVADAGAGAVVLMHQGGGGMESIEVAYQRELAGGVSTLNRATAEALRDLGAGCQILVDLGLSELRLLSSSQRPIVGIDAYGLSIAEHVPLG